MIELNSLLSAGIPQPLPRGVDRGREQLQEALLLGFERVVWRRPLLAHPCRRLRAWKRSRSRLAVFRVFTSSSHMRVLSDAEPAQALIHTRLSAAQWRGGR
jgi:hypothetical protein